MPAPRSGRAVLGVGPELRVTRRCTPSSPYSVESSASSNSTGAPSGRRGPRRPPRRRARRRPRAGPRSAPGGRRRRRRSRSTAAEPVRSRSSARSLLSPRAGGAAERELTIRDADPSATPPPARRSTRPRRGQRRLLRGAGCRAPTSSPRGSRAPPRTHPWLVAERGGEVVGYAYACPHKQRPAYRWAADVSVYVAAAHRGRASAGRSTRRSSSACAPRASASPAPASRCRTPPASACTSASASPGRRLPRDRLEGRRLARRRLVAAAAGAGRDEPPPEPLPPG